MKSIIQKNKECYICKTTLGLHKHHIFFGANRKISETDGCWCYLCGRHHNLSKEGVHFNRDIDLMLKRIAQANWEKTNGSREEFIKRYGKNYL